MMVPLGTESAQGAWFLTPMTILMTGPALVIGKTITSNAMMTKLLARQDVGAIDQLPVLNNRHRSVCILCDLGL